MSDLEKALSGLARLIRRIGGGAAAATALQFASPSVVQQGNDIVISGTLQGAITNNAARIMMTGAPVTIRFEGHLAAAPESVGSQRALSMRTIRYDGMADTYTVWRDGSAMSYRRAADAVNAVSSYRIVFHRPNSSTALHCRIEATISYRSAIGIEDTSQALWDYSTPYVRITDLHKMLPPAPARAR